MAKKRRVEKPREYTRRQMSHFQQQKRRQRLIFISGIGIIAAVLIIVLVGWVIAEYIPLHRTVVTVNEQEINMRFYVDALKLSKISNPDATKTIPVLAVGLIQQIEQSELIKQGAIKLGIKVEDAEAVNILKNLNLPADRGYVEIIKHQLYQQKLQQDYFDTKVPASDNQVNALIMMLESDIQVQVMRDRIMSGDNFTSLAELYALNYYSKNVNKGDFGWHPQEIYQIQLGTTIPVDYAFAEERGALSPPLSDNETYKQLGYWLLRVNTRQPAESENASASANVSAILLSSLQQAENIKTRLEAGEDLGPLAAQYSGYSVSKDKGGELGIVSESSNISTPFNNYVFSPDTEPGKWSDPIRDELYWTQGGSWLVKIVDKDNNKTLTSEDRNTLIQQLLNDWISEVQSDPANKVDDSYFDESLQQWAILRAQKELTG